MNEDLEEPPGSCGNLAGLSADVPTWQWNAGRRLRCRRRRADENFARVEGFTPELAGLTGPERFRVAISPFFPRIVEPPRIQRGVLPSLGIYPICERYALLDVGRAVGHHSHQHPHTAFRMAMAWRRHAGHLLVNISGSATPSPQEEVE